MAKKIVAQPQPRPQPNPTYCPRCNESELFCFCGIELPKSGTLFAKQAKALEVKRIKRGTFLFSFGGAK